MSISQLVDKKFFKTVVGFSAILAVAGMILSITGYYYESNLKIERVTTEATMINAVKK